MKGKFYKVNLEINRPIINILGEICWGFEIIDFEKKIGEKKEFVENFLKRLIKEEKDGIIDVSLSASEIEVIRNSLKEVEKEIEKWEFQTRIGFSLEEINNLPVFIQGLTG